MNRYDEYINENGLIVFFFFAEEKKDCEITKREALWETYTRVY